MVEELGLSEEVSKGIASRFPLEDIPESTEGKTAEEIAAEEAAIEAAKGEKGEGGDGGTATGDNKGDKGDAGTSTDDEPKTPIAALIKGYGYTEEDFKDIDINDDSVEGILKFNAVRDELIKNEAINELLGSDADVRDLVEHKAKGLSLDTWKVKKEAENLKLDFKEDDVEGRFNFLVKVYTDKGIPEKRAKLLVEGLKDDNELVSESNKEIATIKEAVTKNAKAREVAEEAAIVAQQKENDEIVKQVNAIIKEGNLDNIIIPDAERKDFNTFLLDETKRSEKHDKLTLKQRMLIDYIVYKDFKVKGLDKVVTQEKKENTPRIRMPKGGDGNSGAGAKEWTLAELKEKLKQT